MGHFGGPWRLAGDSERFWGGFCTEFYLDSSHFEDGQIHTHAHTHTRTHTPTHPHTRTPTDTHKRKHRRRAAGAPQARQRRACGALCSFKLKKESTRSSSGRSEFQETTLFFVFFCVFPRSAVIQISKVQKSMQRLPFTTQSKTRFCLLLDVFRFRSPPTCFDIRVFSRTACTSQKTIEI